MVSKKILGVAIAAAMSAPAFAVIDLTGGVGGAGSGAVTYAKESITSAQVTSGMVQVAAAGTELDVQVATGFGVTATTHAFVRFNLTNAKFKTAVVAGDLTAVSGTITTVTVAQGGAAGDDYVIFDVESGGLSQTDKLQLELDDLQVSPTAAATISFAHYATSPNAVAQSGALASDSYAGVSVANVLTATITPADRVASVNATPVFTQFVNPASATASLGTFQFDITAGALTAAGVAVTALNQVIDTGAAKSTLTVTGDLSYTLGANAGATAANLKFGTVASNTAATNVPSAKLDNFSTLPFVAGVAYPVEVTATSAINAGSYSLAATLSPIATAAYGPSNVSGALGTVTREGTTIQVPYITTFADYNQRLVLVNRGASAVPYTISFTEEAGVTATAGSMATGTLAANETKIIKATDIVTLAGATRTAATVVVTAPSSTIDAATTSVNLSDKSTDTVKLQ
jgi:hypothetical protein